MADCIQIIKWLGQLIVFDWMKKDFSMMSKFEGQSIFYSQSRLNYKIESMGKIAYWFVIQ